MFSYNIIHKPAYHTSLLNLRSVIGVNAGSSPAAGALDGEYVAWVHQVKYLVDPLIWRIYMFSVTHKYHLERYGVASYKVIGMFHTKEEACEAIERRFKELGRKCLQDMDFKYGPMFSKTESCDEVIYRVAYDTITVKRHINDMEFSI